MTTGDILGGILFVGYGLWLAIFPGSVINVSRWLWLHQGNFWRWLHPVDPGSYKPLGIRIAGVAWIALVLIVMALRFFK